jgi:hypothetical protein
MKTNADQLVDMFRTNVRFVVPPFQRRYVWTITEWRVLWGDVANATEQLADSDAEPNHFLGAVVLEQQSSPSPNTKTYIVVDGQQRLTSLQLLFAAARDVAQELGLEDRCRIPFERLTMNEDETTTDEDHRFKVWPTRFDQPAFRQAMLPVPRPAQGVRKSPKPTILQAFEFFVEELTKWVGQLGAADRQSAFERLARVCQVGMYAVVIHLEDDDNPQAIFESLNSRGSPLRASDHVRNFLFRAATERKLPAERLYNENWARFDDGLWRENMDRRAQGTPRMDAFLSDFLTVELQHVVAQNDVFITFRSYVESNLVPLEELMQRVSAYADVFDALVQGRGEGITSYEEQFLRRLRVLDITVADPVLLRLIAEYDAAVREPAVRALDSYFWRRALLRLGTDRYRSVMLDVIEALDDLPDDPGAAVVGCLAKQPPGANFWPSDDDVTRAVAATPVYQVLQKARLRELLTLIDAHDRSHLSEYVIWDLGRLTVEHLMPQSWRYWPLTTATAADRQRLLHTLGNLTLVTGPLNEEMANSAWPVKLAALLEHSQLRLNRSLPAAWDEAGIAARNAEFADVLIQALPRPETRSDAAEDPVAEPDPDEGSGSNAEGDSDGEVAPPRRRSKIADHILHVLQQQPPGTVLTVSQLAAAPSPTYPEANAPRRSVNDAIKQGTVSGVEATTNDKGYRAAVLAEPLAPRRATAVARPNRTAPPLEAQFNTAMKHLCVRAAKDAKFRLNGLRAMINTKGGLWAAQKLLSEPGVSDGFRRLAELGRLDLTVEALVGRPEFESLFTDQERAIAQDRLFEFDRTDRTAST